MNVATISTVSNATQAAVESIQNHGQKHQTTYKIEMLDDSMASDDDDDDMISSDGSIFDENELAAVQDDLANQLAAAGPVGVAAAAAIASSKKRKRQHSFETNPSVRKRQQNRLLRKLRGIIYEFTGRVGKQAVVLVATPGKPNTSYKVFGAKPLEDVVRNLKNIVMDELENALAQQAPPPPQEDPSLFELPPLIIDGIPTPVEKMTQAQLRAFIPLMLKYSTGRGKPGWGREATRPPWWPKELPWANVRMDARSEDDKQKISWTHALRKIVINCYKYHGREDLLPTFADEDDKVSQLISHEEEDEEEEVIVQPVNNNNNTTTTIQTVTNAPTNNTTTTNVRQQVNVVKINSSGTVITTTNPHNPNNPGPTIIQSTNDQHITTTARLPASTKIELCPAPITQITTHHQQQQQQHHQQQQQQQHHQQTTAASSATTTTAAASSATTTSSTAATSSATTTAAQQHQTHQTQQHQQIHTTTNAAQTIANAQVCIEPMTLGDVDYTTQTVLSTIQNADGTVSLIQVDPNNPIITLPDGTTAQVQGVATLHQGEGGATIQTVQSLADVNGHENMTVDLTEATVAQDGQIYITTEDGQGYPVSVSNMITVPVSASMYQSMMANIQQIHTNSDGTVCITPMQVDASNNNNSNNVNNNSSSSNHDNGTNGGNEDETSGNGNGGGAGGVPVTPQQFQCYSIMAATPIATQRLLAHGGLGQSHNLVQALNFNSNNNNNSCNSNSSGNNSTNSDNSSSSSNCNNNTGSTNNNNNIRCQIINASSLVTAAAATNNSSQQQNAQQQLQHHHQTIINQQSLTNVLQNAGAKVFIAANPAHLNLTAANLLNNNDATTANNNHINVKANNNGQIKFATALPIVVATANAQQHPTAAAAALIATTAGAAAGGMGVTTAGMANKQHRRRNHGPAADTTNNCNNSNNNYLKTGHKRRKHNNMSQVVVVPVKIEEGVDINTSTTTSGASALLHSSSDDTTNRNNHAEGLLDIQIVDDSLANDGSRCGRGDDVVNDGVANAGVDTNPVSAAGSSSGSDAAGSIVGVCGVGSVRVGNRLLSVDVSKTIKLESLDK
ncbi:LOW QUALITY PROTEIN: DNA-binding protein Ewg [Musca domestica]|uniref:LOW QUALITY PROTEIN: DNA-binding protein Ewg n=1 Tax=Musca domestica TaxID=7370 RepID=A0A9J7IEH7_MUSDO|nr:LOW QUALITY PROTEIN: DNA-binding protein Ewg [Musca domestica]